MRRSIGTALRAAMLVALVGADRTFAQSSDFVDTAANVLAIFIIIAVPIGFIVLFWLVHVLPEKIAEKRQHPQKEAIHVLCLLSLFFGGLLWPLAWLWAYTKPVLHKVAYGRDKHDDFYATLEAEARASLSASSVVADVARLRSNLDALELRGELPEAMKALRQQLVGLELRTQQLVGHESQAKGESQAKNESQAKGEPQVKGEPQTHSELQTQNDRAVGGTH